MNLDTVIVIAPLLGSKGHHHVQTEPGHKAAPLLGVLDREEGSGWGYDVHLLIVS